VDRVAIHECGHGLFDVICLGRCGLIEIDQSAKAGRIRPVWLEEKQLPDGDLAETLYYVCRAMGGKIAEELGKFTGPATGCQSDEFLVERELLAARKHRWGATLDQENLEVTTKFLIKTYWRAVVFAAACLRPGSLRQGKDLVKAFLHGDATGDLARFVREPLMGGPNWQDAWHAVPEAAGLDYARAYLSMGG
jgi:hypothetical protein